MFRLKRQDKVNSLKLCPGKTTLQVTLTLMNLVHKDKVPKQLAGYKKAGIAANDDTLRPLAFENSLKANIITVVSNGKIMVANSAACKLLGYSKRNVLTKNWSDIFDIKEFSFKKMLKQRGAEGHSTALVTARKKNGRPFSCEITSAVFTDKDGVEKAIITIEDMSQRILKQKNIDIKKEKIVAGNIVLAKSRQKHIDDKKEKKVVGNIILARSRQKHIDDKKEKKVVGNIILARSRQKSIDTKKEKIVGNNIILAQAKSDARQARSNKQNNKWIKYIGKVSYDVMWDWNIRTGNIYVGDSIKEVFGYKVANNIVCFTDFTRCLLPEEKPVVEKKINDALASKSRTWKDTYMLRRHNGIPAYTISRAIIIRDRKGKAIRLIGAIKDVSVLQGLKENLKEQITLKKELSQVFKVAAGLSFDGIWDWNLSTGDFFLGEGFGELFGYPVNVGADWANYLHPDDKKVVEKGLKDAIASSATRWEQGYRFVRADGSVASVFTRASIIRDSTGKACRIVGVMQDMSKQQMLENRLEQEIKLKEKQIAEATNDAKDIERADIGKELHDNVNQLLGVSRMYLEMAKRGGTDSGIFLSRSSEYTTTAIEAIRKLTKGLATDIIKNLGLCEAIENLIRDIMEVTPVKIHCALKSFTEHRMNDKFRLNIFRILQEHLNNILKHARATKITIRLSQTKETVILSMLDNGIGFDTGKKRKGIGIDNIKSRVKAFNGTVEFTSQAGSGCALTVTFPVTDALLIGTS